MFLRDGKEERYFIYFVADVLRPSAGNSEEKQGKFRKNQNRISLGLM